MNERSTYYKLLKGLKTNEGYMHQKLYKGQHLIHFSRHTIFINRLFFMHYKMKSKFRNSPRYAINTNSRPVDH